MHYQQLNKTKMIANNTKLLVAVANGNEKKDYIMVVCVVMLFLITLL